MCGVPIVSVDVGPGVVPAAPARRWSARCGEWLTARDVPVVPVDVGPGVGPVSREVVAVCGVQQAPIGGQIVTVREPGVVPVSREVVAVCGVPSSKLTGKSPSQAMFSRTMLDWALSCSTVGLETELDLVLCAALSVREPLPQFIIVTSNASNGSPFVTAFLLPLMVVEVLWSLLL